MVGIVKVPKRVQPAALRVGKAHFLFLFLWLFVVVDVAASGVPVPRSKRQETVRRR